MTNFEKMTSSPEALAGAMVFETIKGIWRYGIGEKISVQAFRSREEAERGAVEDLKKAEWYLWDQCDAPGPGGNEGVARIIFSLIPRRAFDSPLRHSLIEDVLYGRFDEACESLEAWIAKAEKEAENANH